MQNWLSCSNYFQNIEKSEHINKKDIEFIASKLECTLTNKKIEKACNWLTLGLILKPNLFVETLRKKGTLRPSKYEFDVSLLPKVITRILKKISLPANANEYLSSAKNLSIAAHDIFLMQKEISAELKRGKGSILRYLLIFADAVFFMQTKSLLPVKEQGVVTDLTHFNAEDIAEAVSYILDMNSTKFGDADHPDKKYKFSDFNIEEMVLAAAKIRRFYEFEILIDRYGYSLTASPENSKLFTLLPPSDDFEKAYRYGYITTDQQFQIKSLAEYKNENIVKLEDVGSELYDRFSEYLIHLIEEPKTRYVMMQPLHPKFQAIISHDTLFSEEYYEVDRLSKEWHVSHEEILNFNLTDDVTMMDLLKIHRYFNLLRWTLMPCLFPLWDTEKDIVIESLVPSMSGKDLKMMLDFALGKSSEPAINYLCYKQSSISVFDIQYQPIVKKEQYYSIPYNILANSNILRNSLQLSGKRFYEDGKNDPISQQLYNAALIRTEQVKQNQRYKDGELDVVALIDGFLFVFECKNPTLPCNPFEARTSYDYIKKAAEQLDRFKENYNSKEFRESFGRSLGWNITSAKLVTCIVMSNRMFLGHRVNGHAVRGIRDIITQIDSGIISMLVGIEDIEEKRFWRGDNFSGEDLRRYIEEDTLIKPVWNAMLPTEKTYPLKEHSIKQKSFALNLELLAKGLEYEKTLEKIAQLRQSSPKKHGLEAEEEGI